MIRLLLRSVALTSAFTLLVNAQDTTSAPTSTGAPKAITTLGCYQHPDPLTDQGDYNFQSSGYCQTQCTALGKAVMAITGGSTCYCGDEIPALDQEVDPTKCNTICAGYGDQFCGGIGFWQVYLTGLTGNVETAPNSTTSSSSSSSSTQGQETAGSTAAPSTVTTKPAETVVVTASASAAPQQNKSSGGGSNTVAIAVGVVVGVIGFAAIVGGVLLYIRRKRNREIEEEHRRNAAVSSFVGSTKSDKSSNDQRLDPSIYSHRRQSIGSIADERDFSRRILQVRNPDRGSKQSNMATNMA